MKIRNGFVSNSSSSSFICESNRTVYHGQDASPYDFGLVECEKCGKTFDPSCAIGEIESKKCEDDENRDYDDNTVGKEKCPYCNMKKIAVNDEIRFFRKLNGIETEEDLVAFIQKTGLVHDEDLKEYVRGVSGRINFNG